MKNIIYTILLLLSTFTFISCDRDEDHDHNIASEFDYRISINSPSEEPKSIQDSIHLHVDFISDKSATIHHINIKIYEESTGEVIYNKPNEAHIHETSGFFEWHNDFALSTDNGIQVNSTYILEAKVWGHSPGLEEVLNSISFAIVP